MITNKRLKDICDLWPKRSMSQFEENSLIQELLRARKKSVAIKKLANKLTGLVYDK